MKRFLDLSIGDSRHNWQVLAKCSQQLRKDVIEEAMLTVAEAEVAEVDVGWLGRHHVPAL